MLSEGGLDGGAAAIGRDEAIPFEQNALESCLKLVCQRLHESVRLVEPRLRKVLFESVREGVLMAQCVCVSVEC